MSGGSEAALIARNDQLLTALREALRLLDSRGLGVSCSICGARVDRSCFEGQSSVEPHEARIVQTREEARKVLLAGLECGKIQR